VKKIIILFILSVLFTLFPLSVIWLQQNLVIGLNPFIGFLLFVLLLLLALGFILWIKKALEKHISFTPDMLFIIGLISFLNLMLLQSIVILDSSSSIYPNGNYNLFSYLNPILIVIVAFSIFAAAYYWFESIFKRKINQSLGYIHFWITFTGLCYIMLPLQELQLIRQARRYLDFSKLNSNNYLDLRNILISTTIIIIISAQLLFIFNILYSLLQSKNVNLKSENI
jgi:cytochrome c oxidase subunit 1